MRMQTTWGLRLIDEVLSHPSTIKIDASDAELDGFSDDTSTEYRQRSVVRTGPGGSLTWNPPSVGARYIGFVIYDSLDTETVEVWVNGVKRGVAAADANNRRERLLTLVEPYDFYGGEQVRLKTPLEEGGTYRIECIALFTDLPPENEIRYGFDRVHAECLSPIHPRGGSGETGNEPSVATSASVCLTWVTTWDARCKVEYWVEGSRVPAVVEEESPWANHRVVLIDLLPDTTYFYRLSALDPDAKIVESETRTFTTSPPQPGIGGADSERIPLTIRNPSDVPYNSVPVTGGIPFPTGVCWVLQSTCACLVRTERRSRCRPARWGNGSMAVSSGPYSISRPTCRRGQSARTPLSPAQKSAGHDSTTRSRSTKTGKP